MMWLRRKPSWTELAMKSQAEWAMQAQKNAILKITQWNYTHADRIAQAIIEGHPKPSYWEFGLGRLNP